MTKVIDTQEIIELAFVPKVYPIKIVQDNVEVAYTVIERSKITQEIVELGWKKYIANPYIDSEIIRWVDQNRNIIDIYEALLDENDDTYIEGPANSSVYKTKLDSMSIPDDLYSVQVVYNYSIGSIPGNANLKVRLLEGSTTIVEYTHISIPSTWTSARPILTYEQASSITNWGNLYLEFEAY